MREVAVDPVVPPRAQEASEEATTAWPDARLVATLLGESNADAARASRVMSTLGLDALREARAVGDLEGAALEAEDARRLLAAVELGRRLHADPHTLPSFASPEIVYAQTRDVADDTREQFVAVLLDGRHRFLRRVLVSVGTLTASLVHPREVFRAAIALGAGAIVLVHNHPSGDVSPSVDDVAITDRLIEAGRLTGIRVLDHVIVSRTRYLSMRREGVVAFEG